VERGDRQIQGPVPQESDSGASIRAAAAGNATGSPIAGRSDEAAAGRPPHRTAAAINSARAPGAGASSLRSFDLHAAGTSVAGTSITGTSRVEPRVRDALFGGALFGDAVRCSAANHSNRRGRPIRY
jgi:hypothetical protein